MIGSCKVHLKQLTTSQTQELHKLSRLLCKLYNVALAEVSSYYADKGCLPSNSYLLWRVSSTQAYKVVGASYNTAVTAATANYRLYLDTCKCADRCTKDVATKKGISNVHPPKPKESHVAIRIVGALGQGAMLRLPATSVTSIIELQLPAQYASKQVNTIIVHQLNGKDDWEVILSYYIRPTPYTDGCNSLGIDIGVSNLATCATSDGKSFIMDGKYIKGLIYQYSKQRKRLLGQSKGSYSPKLAKARQRNCNRINDYIAKCIHYIVQYCVDNQISTICLGWGIHFQQYTLGKSTFLTYHYFPFSSFARKLKHKCAKHGVTLKIVDESFSSVASFYDHDPMPQHITRQKQHFSGKRRYRGLYISKHGTKINADVNAALNILRKGNAISPEQIEAICNHGIAQPVRINPLKV